MKGWPKLNAVIHPKGNASSQSRVSTSRAKISQADPKNIREEMEGISGLWKKMESRDIFLWIKEDNG